MFLQNIVNVVLGPVLRILNLTPNHIDKPQALVPLSPFFDELSVKILDKLSIKTRWDERQRIKRRYFQRFQHEYLDMLKKEQGTLTHKNASDQDQLFC